MLQVVTQRNERPLPSPKIRRTSEADDTVTSTMEPTRAPTCRIVVAPKPTFSTRMRCMPVHRRQEELTSDSRSGNGADYYLVNRNGGKGNPLGDSGNGPVMFEAPYQLGARRPTALLGFEILSWRVPVQLGRGRELREAGSKRCRATQGNHRQDGAD
jgi:hypothetical protein